MRFLAHLIYCENMPFHREYEYRQSMMSLENVTGVSTKLWFWDASCKPASFLMGRPVNDI